jgi:hypothetical protein
MPNLPAAGNSRGIERDCDSTGAGPLTSPGSSRRASLPMVVQWLPRSAEHPGGGSRPMGRRALQREAKTRPFCGRGEQQR